MKLVLFPVRVEASFGNVAKASLVAEDSDGNGKTDLVAKFEVLGFGGAIGPADVDGAALIAALIALGKGGWETLGRLTGRK